MAKVVVSRWLPAFIEFEGAQIAIEVKRLDLAPFLAHEEKYFSFARPAAGDQQDPETVKARALELLAWLEQVFTDYVRVKPNELADEEGNAIVSGADLYRIVGAQTVVMMEVATQVWAQNRLPEEVRKNLRSLSASATISTASNATAPEADGPKPAPTVASVETSDSAPIVDAGPEEVPIPSGETNAS